MVDLVDKTVHDIVEECHLLAVEVPGSGYEQVRYLAQAREPIFLREMDASNSSMSDWWLAALFWSVEFRFRPSSKGSSSGIELRGIFNLGDVVGAAEIYFTG